MRELDERQICLGCKQRINLLIDGFRCLDCPFFFCRPCAEYHFGKTDVSPVTGEKDPPKPPSAEVERLVWAARTLIGAHEYRQSFRLHGAGAMPEIADDAWEEAREALAAFAGKDPKG